MIILNTFLVNIETDVVQMCNSTITKKEVISRLVIAEDRNKAKYNFQQILKNNGMQIKYKDIRCTLSNTKLIT